MCPASKPQPNAQRGCLHLPWGQSRCLKSGSSSSPGSAGDGTDYSHTALPKSHEFPREGENWMMDNPYFTGQPANYCRPKCFSLSLSLPGDWVQGHTTQTTMKGRQPCGSSQKASFPPLLPSKSFILSQEKPAAQLSFLTPHFLPFKTIPFRCCKPFFLEVCFPRLPTNDTAGLPWDETTIF